MRIRALILVWALAGTALAEEPVQSVKHAELGIRYWLSTGETKSSHNAQSVDPTLGNPTSVLLYENLDANVLELFGRRDFHERWFLKGILGVGSVKGGSFDDEDFNAGQVKFSDTTSSVKQGRIGYGVLDLGWNVWVLGEGRTTIGEFVGYSQWTEKIDAYGATDHLGFIGGDIPADVKVVTNKVTWKSLRVGLAANVRFAERSRLGLDVALIPYSKVRNEDSHHLRDDFGPVPNILLEGDGRGVQLDAELRYEIRRRTELSVGVRYWYIEATDGTRSLPNRPDVPNLPIVELYSMRTGVTLSLQRLW
jgi:outer membrane protease